MLQKTALTVLKSGANVFLTGSAGTGKTYVLNQYIQYLRERSVPVALTASTGIAATHIGGQTIHSWSGLGIEERLTEQDLENMARKKPLRKRLEKAQVLIIDEISMLSKQTLTNIDAILKFFKSPFEAFGGIQVVFSGDFFQLPPVSRERIANREKFAFMAPAWVESALRVCYLTEQFRQRHDDLASFLNEIRSGAISADAYARLQERIEQSVEQESFGIKLFTHNVDVDRINQQKLAELSTPAQQFDAETSGNKAAVSALKKAVLASEKLILKEGAKVIFVKNNYDMGYLNGTMGTVTDFSPEGLPVVTTNDDRELVVAPEDWKIQEEMGEPVASFSQIPLRLAWAITVHKSQGMTLDEAEMDLSKTFEPGQGYVALSRVTSWSGMRLLGCNQTALQLAPLAVKADRRFQELSAENEAATEVLNNNDIQKNSDQFIISCGGTTDPQAIKTQRKKMARPTAVEKKVSTYEQTRQLVESGVDLAELVKLRGLSEGTIVGHLEKLKQQHPELDLSPYKPDSQRLAEMIAGFSAVQKQGKAEDLDAEGQARLRSVFEALEGKYEYRELKLARIFIEE